MSIEETRDTVEVLLAGSEDLGARDRVVRACELLAVAVDLARPLPLAAVSVLWVLYTHRGADRGDRRGAMSPELDHLEGLHVCPARVHGIRLLLPRETTVAHDVAALFEVIGALVGPMALPDGGALWCALMTDLFRCLGGRPAPVGGQAVGEA